MISTLGTKWNFDISEEVSPPSIYFSLSALFFPIGPQIDFYFRKLLSERFQLRFRSVRWLIYRSIKCDILVWHFANISTSLSPHFQRSWQTRKKCLSDFPIGKIGDDGRKKNFHSSLFLQRLVIIQTFMLSTQPLSANYSREIRVFSRTGFSFKSCSVSIFKAWYFVAVTFQLQTDGWKCGILILAFP